MLRGVCLLLGLILLASASHVVPPPTTPPPPLSPCCALTTIASCFGYNATDSTAILQAALSCPRAQTVKVDLPPSGVWNTQPLLIQGRTDLLVLIAAGTTLRAVRGAFHSSGAVLLTILQSTNITVMGENTTVQMWRSDYSNSSLYNHSEWRHGISILTSNQVTVVGVTVTETGGDGIYVGAKSNSVNISSVALIANYRNAMSVTGVVGLTVENSLLTETKGTCCMSGVDLEPGTPEECVRDVVFRNCTFSGNAMNQVTVALHDQQGVIDSVLFDNCLITDSPLGGVIVLGIGGSGARANITFRGVTVANTRDYGLNLANSGGPYASLNLENVNLTNTAQAGHWPILIEGGSVTFSGGSVTDLHNRPFLIGGWRSTTGVQNITGSITVYSAYPTVGCVPDYQPANVSTSNDLSVTCVKV